MSPANCGGERARLIFSERAKFPLAQQLRSREGAPLGDVFSFVSGLYFRGKLTYARTFAQPPTGSGVLVITAGAGLLSPDTAITLDALRTFACVDVSAANLGYRGPLEESARALRRRIGAACEVVLLGSIASGKYVDVLATIFGRRLLFPPDFVGRGDMSRGGLLLRCVAAGRELDYVPVVGSVRHGARPPRLGSYSEFIGHRLSRG
ncbi:MAG: hypothetical protein HYS05_19645 [Acidobacteria bacterium]|nr:hypothetical protein [Acidobacteriota bacterium]